MPKDIKVKSNTKTSQPFMLTSKSPYAHKERELTTPIISSPPRKGVPYFHPCDLSKNGVGLSKISTVLCF